MTILIETIFPPRRLWRLFVPIVATFVVPAVGAADVELTRRVTVMGTVLKLEVSAGDRASAVTASQAAIDAVEAVDSRLSTWREESELSRLNRAEVGAEVAISPELEADLRDARRWWRETGGLFDPGIASLVAAWDLRGGGRVPSPREIVAAKLTSGFDSMVLGAGCAQRAIDGFGIEEGGFGKGIALRDAARAAIENGATCAVIDLGGQVVVSGACGSRGVDIAHPRRRDEFIGRLNLRSGTAATSGNSERGFVIDGVRYGHLLDPTTGHPVNDWGAVTVVAADPVAADCLATALFVMGPRRGAEWLRGRPDVEAIFAETAGDSMIVTATPSLRDRLVVFEETEGDHPKTRVAGEAGSSEVPDTVHTSTGKSI